MSTPFTCDGCGDRFETDPRLAVECPDCHAPIGSKCRRPSEHVTDVPHRARRALAFKQLPCSCEKNWLTKHPEVTA